VDAASTGLHADGVLQVEHLVVEQILDRAPRRIGSVEDAAHDNGVVGGIVVAQRSAGMMGAPGQRWSAQQTVEETRVNRLEDFVEIVMMAGGGGKALAAAGLANLLGLFGYGLGRDVSAIPVRVVAGDRLLVELGEKDMRDGVMDRLGGWLEQVGEADVQAAFAESDGRVQRGEAAEADIEWRDRSAGTEFAIFVLEDGNK
jgi:hypothetical protein